MTDADLIAILLIVRAGIALLPKVRQWSDRRARAGRMRRSLRLAVRRELAKGPAFAHSCRPAARIAALPPRPSDPQSRIAA